MPHVVALNILKRFVAVPVELRKISSVLLADVNHGLRVMHLRELIEPIQDLPGVIVVRRAFLAVYALGNGPRVRLPEVDCLLPDLRHDSILIRVVERNLAH